MRSHRNVEHFCVKSNIFTIFCLFPGEEVSYGVLVKKKSHYDFFQPVIENNKIYLQTVVSTSSYSLQKELSAQKPHLFKQILVSNVIFFCVTIAAVLCIGLIAESYRNKQQLRRMQQNVSRRISCSCTRRELGREQRKLNE